MIDPSMEFRGFVCNGELNALSQYNHLCFYSHLVAQRDARMAAIQDFFNTRVKDRLASKFREYVIDFALVSKDGQWGADEIFVIELNPFLFSTDGALFSWQQERGVLENGPFEYRLLEKPIAGVKARLNHDWRDVLEQETRKLKKEAK